MTAGLTLKRKRPRVRPGLMSGKTAARYCDRGYSTWQRLNAAGLVPEPIRLGGAVMWSKAELSAWIRHGCPDRRSWSAIWKQIRTSFTRSI